MTTQTCGRRMAEWGPWDHKEGLDGWRVVGTDRCCTFCGSMHPDDFIAFLKLVCDPTTEHYLGTTDKSYKYYVHQPGVKNAMAGAIKFYMQHAPMSDVPDYFDKEFIGLLRKAIEASEIKYEAKEQERLKKWDNI